MSAIDISEVLSYQPELKKRRMDGEGETENGEGGGGGGAPNLEALLAEAGESEETEPLDETRVKQMILNFEKRALRNQEMRIKFPDDPSKFMESEVELNVAVQEMHALATIPDLYSLLTELNAVESFLQLLAHENSDIIVAVMDLLQELTDVETAEESREGVEVLVEGLVGGQIVARLVQSMEKLDESVKDEADGVHNALGVLENLLELKSEMGDIAVTQGLVTWLLRRVRQKGFDGNKLYASEVLAMILQQTEAARKFLGDQDGIDILLQALAAFKRHDPASADERELMENLFDGLCACLMVKENRKKFLDGEGLQLMNLMLRERKESRASALKVINHATSGEEGKENSDKFVEILGLRTLFPLFLKTPGKQKRKGHSAKEHEEHVTAIVGSLLRNCSSSNRQRILAKFTESDHLKVDRLVELHLNYSSKLRRWREIKKEDLGNEEKSDELLVEELDAGLFTLQFVDLILADVWVNGPRSIKHHANKLLAMKGESPAGILKVLKGYVDNLGPEAKAEESRVQTLINGLKPPSSSSSSASKKDKD